MRDHMSSYENDRMLRSGFKTSDHTEGKAQADSKAQSA